MASLKPYQTASDMNWKDRFHNRLAWCSAWSTFLMSEDSGVWRPISEDALSTMVLREVVEADAETSITPSKLRDIIDMMKRTCSLRWEDPKERYVVFSDRWLDLKTLKPVEPVPSAHLRGDIALISFPFPYPDDTPPTPVFDRFLETSLVKKGTDEPDAALATIVEEMLGYLMLPSVEASAAFFLYGAGKNGKSKLADLCRLLVGDDLSVALTLEGLTANRFAAATLVGKKLNVCNEDESKYLMSDKFKAIVSGEYITAERKYGANFSFRPSAKYIFCTNSQPRFDGLNYGLKRRVKIIPFYRQIPESEKDIGLHDKLVSELPGIVARAMTGARRLVANKYVFSEADSVSEEMEEFENAISSAVRFVRERYRLTPEGFVENGALYEAYKVWCEVNGNKPMGSMNFHKDIVKNLGLGVSIKNVEGVTIRGKSLSDIDTETYSEATLL